MNVEEQSEQSKIVMKRNYSASPEKLYSAWTDANFLAKWFRPNERWIKVETESDPVVGGKYSITMTHLDGDSVNIFGNYLDLEPGKLVKMTWASDWDDDRTVTTVTVSLVPIPNGTELTLVHENLKGEEARSGADSGWQGCLDSLGKCLSEVK